MNIQEYDILNTLLEEPYVNQRYLAERSGYSLGKVNQSLKALVKEGYLEPEGFAPTGLSRSIAGERKPRNAVILAAGFGMRMVPINTEVPKGLLQVGGETLIEHTIRQLHEAGITDITVVVGYLKEQYEFLIDRWGVRLVINMEYARKNNIHSLYLASGRLSNTYIIPCDLWCEKNPFSRLELYSWYMVGEEQDEESTVRVNRRMELVATGEGSGGNRMFGIAYLLEPEAAIVRERLEEYDRLHRYDQRFWEETLYQEGRLLTAARVVSGTDCCEVNTYEQLRELDHTSENLDSTVIRIAAEAMGTGREEITDIEVLKKGMTNRSFQFTNRGKRYIMRIPGEGTDELINRKQEYAVYQAIAPYNICDNVSYISPDTGYKITEYLENARVCDPENPEDVRRCMQRLREFHGWRLQVEHTFDLFGQLEFYETLRQGGPSCFRDYEETKAHVLEIGKWLEGQPTDWCLTHIDAVPDNFLFAGEEIRLIDWEYAGMQDPHVDIAMFAIYSLYDREHTEALIDAYFPEGCPRPVRRKIYGYIAVCGLLWSNWCEYKRILGVEFGEYALRQYRYAKEYYRIFMEEEQ